jgi:hypothetical protein
MKAKCPYCLQKLHGCEKCNFIGQIQVNFDEGDWWQRVCQNPECLFINGCYICNGFPSESSGLCVECNSETKWVSINDPILETIEQPWIQNHYKFLSERLEKDADFLREKLKEIRNFTKNIPGFKELALSVKEAQLMGVCRFCKENDLPRVVDGKNDPFVLDYGVEYAHKSCLKQNQINGEIYGR